MYVVIFVGSYLFSGLQMYHPTFSWLLALLMRRYGFEDSLGYMKQSVWKKKQTNKKTMIDKGKNFLKGLQQHRK